MLAHRGDSGALGEHLLYFDHAASSPLREDVAQTYFESIRKDVGNPSSGHRLGRSMQAEIEGVRKQLASYFGEKHKIQVVFTSSATESNNQAIFGIGKSLLANDKKFVGFLGDHASCVEPLRALQNLGVKGLLLPSLKRDEWGSLDWESSLRDLDTADVGLICLTHVSNLSGDILPLQKLLPYIRKTYPSAHVHLDCVQSFGKLSLDWSQLDFDSLSLSSHKIGGPKGIAALVLKNSPPVGPLLLGGGQENGMRSSTQSVALVKTFSSAVKAILDESRSVSYEEEMEKKRYLQELLKKALGDRVNFPFSLEGTSPYILSFLVRGLSSDVLIRHLEGRDVFLSSSSACSSRQKNYHPSFEALGLDSSDHPHFLRASFASQTSRDKMEAMARHLGEVLEDLEFLLK